jgi:hypothetical protein
MSTRARDWFSDEHEFRQLCGDAQSQATGESSQDFAAEMVIKAKDRGLDTYLSDKQLAWLCKLADWDLPKRRAVNGEAST